MNPRFFIPLLCALLGACTPFTPDFPGPDPGEDGPLVPVTLSLDVAQAEDGMPGTKTDFYLEPEVPGYDATAAIRTVLLLQFDGADKDAQLIGQQQYFDHWPLDPAQGEGFALVARSTPQTVVVLANTFGYLTLTDHTTLGNFLENENFKEIRSLTNVWRNVDEGDDHYHYLQMGGHHTFPSVTESTAMNMTLRRNCAKVVFNITNNAFDKTGDNKVIIEGVQLCSINGKHYYVSDFRTDPDSPADGDPFDFEDIFSYTAPMRFDAEEEPFDAFNDGSTHSFEYYIPANLRGLGSNTDAYATQKTKNVGAPVGATCFRIFAHYGAEEKSIVYTYYLGGDLVNDFNLKPNHKYIYNITLSGKGTPANDFRIYDQGNGITFQVDANCYMLHPSARAGKDAVYAIPVRRARVFWNDDEVGVYGAAGGDNEVLTLAESTAWKASFVWNEIYNADGTKASEQDLLVGSVDEGGKPVYTGRGFNPDYVGPAIDGHDPYIRIKVKPGMKGNALVALRNADGIILWSWHLWVTEYDPDVEMTPKAGTYVYPVPGGSVHRYNNTYWAAGGAYEKAFAMDRNVGAVAETGDNRGVGVNKSYGCYYEWGRKDPFYSRAKWNTPFTATVGVNNVSYSIHHPDIWIEKNGTNHYWTAPDANPLNNAASVWNDPKLVGGIGHGGDACEPNKSIYDPCPPGWQVPTIPAAHVNGFNVTTGDGRTTEYTSVYGGARWCYPEGYANRESKGSFFFPIQDVFYLGLGIQRNDLNCMYLCSYYSQFYYIRNDRAPFVGSIGGAGSPGGAGPVRCVRLH